MPSIKDASTVKAIARVFCGKAKRNKTETLRIVGYKPSYYLGGRSDRAVWGNVRVIAAIKAIDDEFAAEMDLTRKAQYRRLLDIIDNTQLDTVKVSALRELNEMLGYHREAAPNKEKEQALAARMSKEDRELATLAARLRTEQEARRGLKLA